MVRRPLDEDARAAEADLPLVRESAAYAGGDRLFHVGIGENERRVLAAQLERELLEHRRGDACDLGPGLGAARERDRRHLLVRDDRRPRLAPQPVDDVEYA